MLERICARYGLFQRSESSCLAPLGFFSRQDAKLAKVPYPSYFLIFPLRLFAPLREIVHRSVGFCYTLNRR